MEFREFIELDIAVLSFWNLIRRELNEYILDADVKKLQGFLEKLSDLAIRNNISIIDCVELRLTGTPMPFAAGCVRSVQPEEIRTFLNRMRTERLKSKLSIKPDKILDILISRGDYEKLFAELGRAQAQAFFSN